MIFKTRYIFVIHSLFLLSSLYSQEVISLERAIQIADQNNMKLRSDALMVKYQKALVNTAYNIATTQINAELGQFNSSYFDTGFGISQTFSLPQVYRRRLEAKKQQVQMADYYLKISEADIRQQVYQIFQEYSYLTAKEKLLTYQDSLFTVFVEKTSARLRKGESDILENTTATQQKINISNQLAMVSGLKEYFILELEWLLNDGNVYVPENTNFNVLKYNIFYDSLSILKHPEIQASVQEINAARSVTIAEKTALLPEFTVGYKNLSIRGIGSDDRLYNGGDRFSSFQLGIGIPIFRRAIHSSIQASKIMEEIKSGLYTSKVTELRTKISQKYAFYNQTLTRLLQYEQKALANAIVIRDVSEKQFSNGEINYLEYVILTNQATMIEMEYLELMRNLNMTIIDLHFLTNNY